MDDVQSSDLDPSVRRAYEEAKTTMNMGPLIKEELKLTILNRRHIKGMDDIVLDDKKPTVKGELTEEEVLKKLRRKEQNRRAAERCRQKKKSNNEKLMNEYLTELQQNQKYQHEIDMLQKQKADLQQMLDEHACQSIKTPNQTPAFDDRTSFTFPYISCSTPSFQQELVPHRDAQTPFQQDSLDEKNDLNELMYYHPESLMEKDQLFAEMSTCTVLSPSHTDLLPDITLPDDFDVFYQSPDLREATW